MTGTIDIDVSKFTSRFLYARFGSAVYHMGNVYVLYFKGLCDVAYYSVYPLTNSVNKYVITPP